MSTKLFFTLVIVVAVFFGMFLYSKKNREPYLFSDYETRTIVLSENYKINAYRATTKEQRELGLSGTTFLASHDGMLFEFPYENQWYFWMKDMVIPIDIIWVNKDMSVVYIEKNLSPDTYPQSFGPKENALYVLEVASGVSEKVNLTIGDKIIFED